ncbi:sigma-70 family RNA polymerase sigma factor [Luteolibacter flavescens]|uniref:Sigma-70 family RNA polymerase sigma factor n=1 Tax=Luteolibacter flavescens TaxID=1859460 RepID=A0ABT3FLA8_9BACT|nr:sigma-70 family RNA polymerase sigma factor [Luteolibacter flavescens]MCW1884031.1 sigma-70 family RNA polymerase sigma factor [Luteolibacter flavescens]
MSGAAIHSTRWTLVRRAQGRGEEARAALSELCTIYYEPVLHFTRRWCHGSEDRAKDLTHAFFEDLLDRGHLGTPDPAKGRFRSYLLAAVKHHLLHQRERDAAAKRGGGAEITPLDDAVESAAATVLAEWELEYDRAWALALIRRALDSLEAESIAAGKREHFHTLRPWLDGGLQGDATAAAATLQLTPTALKVAIHRLRQKFRQRIRDEIASTADPAEVDAEFRHLVEVWVR